MSNTFDKTKSNFDDERFLDLMIQRATLGLDELEQQELDQLAAASENHQEPERFEVVATAIDLAGPIGQNDDQIEKMPANLRDKLLVDAGRILKKPGLTQTVDDAIKASSQVADSSSRNELEVTSKISSGISRREIFALLTTAACLALLLSGLNPFATKPSSRVAKAIPLSDQLSNFIQSNPADLVDEDWQPVHSKNASGRVVWSDDQQKGFMIFEGLPPNDPNVEQYQLWIFDTDPEQTAPVDGGVFDIVAGEVGPNGQYIVPIRAHVPIGRAVQFAVTIEKPGGVYVSDRSRLPVLAQVKSP